jgi:hypothetical protein
VHNFAARMASRRLSKRIACFNMSNPFSLQHRSVWIALAAAKIVDFCASDGQCGVLPDFRLMARKIA